MECHVEKYHLWDILKNSVRYCISFDDDIAKTMKLQMQVLVGENNCWRKFTPGVISLITSCEDENKKKIGLNKDSNVMLIGCEGDTDQKMYQKLINQ